MLNIPDDTVFSLYEKMYTIRETENLLLDGFSKKLFSGTIHTCIGQEAVSSGVIEALKYGDVIFSNHRGHGHMLAAGLSPDKLVYEIASKDTGQCAGLGGSQHIAAPEIGFMGSNGITGGSVPIAVGHALGNRLANREGISVVFFGDGASSQGAVHEAMNMASIWKLPVIFVCENNMYAMSSPTKNFVSSRLYRRAMYGYNILSMRVDGMNAEEVYRAAVVCRDMTRVGPVYMECETYRYCGHSKSDMQLYRDREEVLKWKKDDPLEKILKNIPPTKSQEIRNKVDTILNAIRKDLGL